MDELKNWVVKPLGTPPKKSGHNAIRTSKYTLVTFLPKNLYIQFHRISNWYFLICAGLNFIPAIQAFGALIAWIPLFFVLSVTAVKDAYEDSRRRKSDKEINSKVSKTVDMTGMESEKYWKKIVVGDVVKICSGEAVPADMLLLHSSDPTGIAFVDTAELDGETNLKARYAFREQKAHFSVDSYKNVSVACEQPNMKIYHFTGVATETGSSENIVSSENLLLRGCVVRNTDVVYGLVLYTGRQTKVMLNNSGPKLKRSALERKMNGGILICLCLLGLMCAIGSIGVYLSDVNANIKEIIFLPYMFEDGSPDSSLNAFIRFFTWLVVLQAIVPLSLYVTIELVKLFQVWMINADIELYDEARDTPMQCRALNISEDLGQIEYVFSDKTGTLTQNVMTFRCCSINGVNYQHGFKGLTDTENDTTTDGEAQPITPDQQLISNLALVNPAGKLGSSGPDGFFVCMALCNTVRPDIPVEKRSQIRSPRKWDADEIAYESESPDEVALASAAQAYGYTLVDSDAVASKKTLNINEQIFEYQVLATLEFDSDRKRMSQIVQTPSGQIVLLCKGADEAILGQLASDNSTSIVSETRAQVNDYARMGLRTLCFALRVVDSSAFTSWLARWNQVRSTLAPDKKQQMSALMHEMESDLILLGATGVEDALQVGVPSTIEQLRKGGINVWVLTGDKQETAIQIANTARLFTSEMQLLYLNSEVAAQRVENLDAQSLDAHKNQCLNDTSRVLAKLKAASQMRGQGGWPEGTKTAMIVDGATLVYALMPSNREAFVSLAVECATLVCSRSTPMQKAQVVTAVREYCSAMTLAIGDGANDASMIQTAHVGVGISGREGRQAVMASDFAIAQFRFLERLLFVHGHWSYDRMSNLVLYFFWKNMMANVLLFFFAPYSWFSGQVSMPQLEVLMYYIIFTSLPPVVTATLDQDVSATSLLQNPTLYEYGRLSEGYTHKKALIYILDAVINAMVIFIVAYNEFNNSPGGLLQFGTLQMTCIVLVGNLWLFIETRTHTWLNHVSQVLMLVIYVAFTFAVSNMNGLGLVPDPYGLFGHVWGSAWYWEGVVFVTLLAGSWRIFLKMLMQFYFPTRIELVREAELKAIQDHWMERNCGVFRGCCAKVCPGGQALHPNNPYSINALK